MLLFVRREKLLNVFDDGSEFSFGYMFLLPKLTAQKTMTIKKLKNLPGKTFKTYLILWQIIPQNLNPHLACLMQR